MSANLFILVGVSLVLGGIAMVSVPSAVVAGGLYCIAVGYMAGRTGNV